MVGPLLLSVWTLNQLHFGFIRIYSETFATLFKSNLLCRWNVCTASLCGGEKARDVIAVANFSSSVHTPLHLDPHPHPSYTDWSVIPSLRPSPLTIHNQRSSSKSGTTGPDCTIFPHISIAAQHAPRFRLSQQRFALSSKHERHLYFACEARAVYSFVCGSCFGHGFLC